MRLLRLGVLPSVLALILLFGLHAGRGAEPPQTWAVVVGIDDYIRKSITDLKYAGSDAKLFAEALRNVQHVPANNIFLFTSDTLDESLQPKLTNIIFRLDWLRKNAKPDDSVIFYFAGHGVTVEGEPFLLTEEADNRSLETLKISALKGADVSKLLSRVPAQNTLVLLDACRNDPSGGRGDTPNALDDKLSRALTFVPDPTVHTGAATPGQRPSSACLFACSVGERSWEWDDKKHGFFTYFLVEAMRQGAATDAQGHVSLQAVVDYVTKNVKETTVRNAAAAQNPMFRYEGPGASAWTLCTRQPTAAPVAFGSEKTQQLASASAIAKMDALQAQLEAAQARERAAKERATIEEAKRRELETVAQLESQRRQQLEGRMVQLERQVKAQPQEVQALKAELEKSKADAAAARQAVAQASAAADEAHKARQKAEQLALEATKSGAASQQKLAEAARVEALARESDAKARQAEARERELASQNGELQKRLAMLEVAAKAGAEGVSHNAAVEQKLAEAQAALAQARKEADAATAQAQAALQARQAAEARVATATGAGKEAEKLKLAEARAQEATKLAAAEELRSRALESEKRELEQKLVALETRLNQNQARPVPDPALLAQLKQSEENERLLKDQIELQRKARMMAEARLQQFDAKEKESDLRFAEFTTQAYMNDVAMAPKLDAKLENSLKADLDRLKQANAKLESDKREATMRAREAEQQVASLENDMEKRYGGKAFGAWGRSTRRIHFEDLAGILKGPEEATELPNSPK